MQVLNPHSAQSVKDAVASDYGEHSTRHMLVSMYRSTPVEVISMDEFERLALERLRVLKGLEDLKLRGKQEAELIVKIKELNDKHLKGSSPQDTARMDQLSHYILRLAYCAKPELRKWFLSMESELFRLRFMGFMELNSDRTAFLKREGLDYAPVPAGEMTSALHDKLRQVQQATGDKEEATQNQQVFKVPFTSVPDLVGQRRVYLQGGWAYVWQKDVASLVVQDFRANLSKGLSNINRRWREMFPDSDLRLRPLVEGLSQRYLGPDMASANQARRADVTVSNLSALSARHFPMCMHGLMQGLRREHHLKHSGRQQLSLFLKSIGLPLEEALVFWRTEFGPKVPADKFEKEYAYNIRHNYGKEGKMVDYTAHTCVSIIRMSGGADEQHGCPYRRMDENTLRANLNALGCEGPRIDEAMQKKAGGHFQLACACAFEGIHRVPTDVGINYPAQYYQESRRVYDEREGRTKETGAATGQQGAGAGAAEGTPGAGGAGVQRRNPFAPTGHTPAGAGAGAGIRQGTGGDNNRPNTPPVAEGTPR